MQMTLFKLLWKQGLYNITRLWHCYAQGSWLVTSKMTAHCMLSCTKPNTNDREKI